MNRCIRAGQVLSVVLAMGLWLGWDARTAVWAQLNILSEGDPTAAWRDAQLDSLRQQLATPDLAPELEQELQSQMRWLSNWKPGSLSDQPLWESKSQSATVEEPILDPDGKAERLRRRLLGKNARPSIDDTRALEKLLVEEPQDIGVRQLHLHWIDQIQYRKQYADDIARAAALLDRMLRSARGQDREIRQARAHCLYRWGRALAYRELPEVVADRPLEDPEEHAAQLVGVYTALRELLGDRVRPEFVLLDIRMLRRDGWYGRALGLLETHGGSVERKWLLKKRRDLLQDLQWQPAFEEVARLYAKHFPEEVAQEAADSGS